MGMNLKFDGGDSEYEVVPVGSHKAICYKVVDAGTAEEDYQGEKSNKHKIFIFWELPEVKTQDGRPMSIFSQYTASLNEKSNLYKAAISWLNRGFTEAEKQGFDPSIFIGKGCKLEVQHTVNGRAKVANVLTAPNAFNENEELRQLPTTNEQMVFDLEDYLKEFSGESCAESKRACDIFDTLPRFIQHRIAGCDEVGRDLVPPCFEMQAALKRGETSGGKQSGMSMTQAEVLAAGKKPSEPLPPLDEDDDIPF